MIGRRGIRVRDLLEPARLLDRLQAVVPDRNATLRWLGRPEVTVEALAAQLAPAAERLALCGRLPEPCGRRLARRQAGAL